MRCRTRAITPAGGVAAVLFQVELAFEGVVDRLDDLAERLEQAGRRPARARLCGRAAAADRRSGKDSLEIRAVVVLVTDQGLRRAAGEQARIGGEHASSTCALIGFRAGQGEGHGQALQGAHQVQAQPPEVAANGWRSTRTRPIRPGQTAWRSPGNGRLHRGESTTQTSSVHSARAGGQNPDHCRISEAAAGAAACYSRAAGAGGEQVPQVSVRVPQPAGLGVNPQQGLHHRQGDQLGIISLGQYPPQAGTARAAAIPSRSSVLTYSAVARAPCSSSQTRSWTPSPYLPQPPLELIIQAGSA